MGTPVHAAWTRAGDGDARAVGDGPAPPPVPGDLVVRAAHQVHGTGVLVVGAAAPPGASAWARTPAGGLPDGDALVGRGTVHALAVLTADCAPVALGSPEGVHGAVHVGWRGLEGGVLGRAVAVLHALGASRLTAAVGPCIGPCCYEFSSGDLDALADAVGDVVRACTTGGRPALDLRAGIGRQLAEAGVQPVAGSGDCTVCEPGYFSHRGRRDVARQAMYVWRAG